jgi:hypothetical protein
MPQGGKRSNSGRKPSEVPRLKRQHKIDEDLVLWLEQESSASGLTLSDLVNQALRGLKAIRSYPKPKDTSKKSIDKIS